MLYKFADNEAVIKMIIKGRSPTMRLVSRTHRVAVDLAVWQNLSGSQNSNQVHWHKTPDCWHFVKEISHAMSGTNLLICFTSAISALPAALRISAWPAAPERWRTGCKNTKETTGSWQSQKPTTMNLAVSVSARSSSVNSPIASRSPGILKALCQTDWTSSGKFDARNSNHDAASSSQGWQKDALLDGGTRKLVATEEDQKHLNCLEEYVGTGKLVAPRIPKISRNSRNSRRLGSRRLTICRQMMCNTWKWVLETRYLKDLDRNDREPMEFE